MRQLIPVFFLLLFLGFYHKGKGQEKTYSISGVLYESDSVSVLPYAYIINTRNGNGTVSDDKGRFKIEAKNTDTLLFSYLGFIKKKYLVSRIPYTADSARSSITVIMIRDITILTEFSITAFRLKKSEIDYMNRVIKQAQSPGAVNAISSPITALYNAYSKKGRETQKLAQLFDRMLTDQMIAQRFNPEILRKLTQDEQIDFEAFKKYCYVFSDDFLINAPEYELYSAIYNRYLKWKEEGH